MADPAYLTAFKAFTRDNELGGLALAAFELEAYGASDRARVVMLSSVAENALDKLLRSKVRAGLNSDDRRSLFDFSGPLGTFGSQTIAAYAFSWIGPNTRFDLDLIRQLRNGFAHCHKPFTLDLPVVAAVCAALKTPDSAGAFIPHGYLAQAAPADLAQAADHQHPRTRFIMTCFTLAERMLGAAAPDEYNVAPPD